MSQKDERNKTSTITRLPSLCVWLWLKDLNRKDRVIVNARHDILVSEPFFLLVTGKRIQITQTTMGKV